MVGLKDMIEWLKWYLGYRWLRKVKQTPWPQSNSLQDLGQINPLHNTPTDLAAAESLAGYAAHPDLARRSRYETIKRVE